jgi:hypothetical protein
MLQESYRHKVIEGNRDSGSIIQRSRTDAPSQNQALCREQVVRLNSRRTSKEIIEDGLGTLGKIKILKSLAENGRMLTIYVLHNKTRLKREDIKRNLNDLMEIGWVKETRMANKMYALDLQNEYVIQIISFFRNVGYID